MNPNLICGYLWAVWLAIWIVWAYRTKKTQQHESSASRLSYAIPAWAAGYLIFYPNNLPAWWHTRLLPSHPWLGWLGVALTFLGFAFTIWARAILGGNWSSAVTIKVAHELIRTGPYRYVRHPIYTGMILAMIGTALARDEYRGLVAVVLLWLSFTIKRLKEEQFMRQTFGAQYIEYCRTTGAIFPTLLRHNP